MIAGSNAPTMMVCAESQGVNVLFLEVQDVVRTFRVGDPVNFEGGDYVVITEVNPDSIIRLRAANLTRREIAVYEYNVTRDWRLVDGRMFLERLNGVQVHRMILESTAPLGDTPLFIFDIRRGEEKIVVINGHVLDTLQQVFLAPVPDEPEE